MAYARQTLHLTSIAPDRIPQDVEATAWDTAQDVMFRNGETVRTSADAPTLPNSTIIPRTTIYLRVGIIGYWVSANEDKIVAHDGATETDITPLVGWAGVGQDLTITFTSCTLSGLVIINASDRDPVYWNGDPGTPAVILPDWPASGRCLAMRSHKGFLFAIGMTTEGTYIVRWSDVAEPGAIPDGWTPTAENLAGSAVLSDTQGTPLDAVTMRDSLIVYTSEGIWSFDFVGGNTVFGVRQLFREHGIAATNAVTGGVNDEHLFVGDDGDCYLTDGVQVKSILDGRAQRLFYGDYSANIYRIFSCVTVSREKLGLIFYPSSGADVADRAITFDFISGDIGLITAPNVLTAAQGAELSEAGSKNIWDGTDNDSWDSDTGYWPSIVTPFTIDDVLLGTQTGFFMLAKNAGADPEGGEVSARAERSGLAFGNPQARKIMSRLWPKVIGTPGDKLTFRLGGQEIAGGPIVLSPPLEFTIGQNAPLDAFVSGRYMSIEVSSFGGSAWRMGSFDVEYREVGVF